MPQGPPDKFVSCDLSGLTPGQAAIAVSNAYAAFFTQFQVYPNVVIEMPTYVLLGAY